MLKVLISVLIVTLFSIFSTSCGNNLGHNNKERNNNESNDIANFADMPPESIINHKNIIEGDLSSPLEAVVGGMVKDMVYLSKEIFVLLETDSFNVPDNISNPINIPNGSEITIRCLKSQGPFFFQVGDHVKFSVRIMKGRNGPVIIGINWDEI